MWVVGWLCVVSCIEWRETVGGGPRRAIGHTPSLRSTGRGAGYENGTSLVHDPKGPRWAARSDRSVPDRVAGADNIFASHSKRSSQTQLSPPFVPLYHIFFFIDCPHIAGFVLLLPFASSIRCEIGVPKQTTFRTWQSNLESLGEIFRTSYFVRAQLIENSKMAGRSFLIFKLNQTFETGSYLKIDNPRDDLTLLAGAQNLSD